MGSAHVSSETKEERGCSGLASNRVIVRSFATRTSSEGMECNGNLSPGLVLSFIGNLKTGVEGENNQ